LWDQITKLILHSSDVAVLAQAMQVVKHLLSFGAMSETNSTKKNDLLQQIVSGIREMVEGRDVATAAFTSEETETLTAWMARLSLISMQLDITQQLEDNGGLKYTSVYTVVDSLAERGMLGSLEEEDVSRP
jgi:glycerol-3-phosphate cytidylyltransferase-like family protein